MIFPGKIYREDQTIMKIIIWWRESNLTKLSRESEKTLVEWF